MLANLPAPPVVRESIRSLLAGADVDRFVAGQGYEIFGLPDLREAIARYYSDRGTETSADQILVTTGTQQAISLVAGLVVSPGNIVVMEDPTYSGAIDAFRARGARLVGVPVGAGGVNLESLRAVFAREPVRVFYTAGVHNPTGTVMSHQTEQGILGLTADTSVTVVDDETLANVVGRDGSTRKLMSASTDTENLITVESISKVFWGGLRVGWVRADERVIRRLGAVKAIADLGSPVLNQVVGAHLMARIAPRAGELGSEIVARRDALVSAIGQHLPSWSIDSLPTAGLSLWTRLPHGRASELAHVARRYGVLMAPGSAMSPEGGCEDRVRIPYVLEAGEMEEGVKRLGEAWADYEASASDTLALPVVV